MGGIGVGKRDNKPVSRRRKLAWAFVQELGDGSAGPFGRQEQAA